MPRKRSDEVRIVQFFQAAPIEAAEAVLAIVTAAVRSRKPKSAKAVREREPEPRGE